MIRELKSPMCIVRDTNRPCLWRLLVTESSAVLPHLRCEEERAVMHYCDCVFVTARKIEITTYLIKHTIYARGYVSEVDPVSAIYPLSFHRRIERQWAERIKSLRRMGGQVVVATNRTLQSAISHDGSLISNPGQNGRGPATM